MKTILIAMLIGACAWSQTATVVKVEKADAADARKKYDAYIAAKAEYDKAEEALKQKYTTEKVECFSSITYHGGGAITLGSDGSVTAKDTPKPKTTYCPQPKREFSCGVEFSPDFRFAVPKACPTVTPSYVYPHINTFTAN
jgi:hypothetical protein